MFSRSLCEYIQEMVMDARRQISVGGSGMDGAGMTVPGDFPRHDRDSTGCDHGRDERGQTGQQCQQNQYPDVGRYIVDNAAKDAGKGDIQR